MNDLILSVKQARNLELALCSAGYSDEEVKQLSNRKLLSQVRQILIGHATIREHDHIIDCDAPPWIPFDQWEVEEHLKGGQLKWVIEQHAHALQFYERMECAEFNERFFGKPVLNANVLDYLLTRTHLIPEEWKGRRVLFLGTRYRDCRKEDGRLYVRKLYHSSVEGEDSWSWSYKPIDNDDYLYFSNGSVAF